MSRVIIKSNYAGQKNTAIKLRISETFMVYITALITSIIAIYPYLTALVFHSLMACRLTCE